MSQWWKFWEAQSSNVPVTLGETRLLETQDAWGNRTKQLGTFQDVASDTRPQPSEPLDIRTAGELYRRGPYARVCNLFALWTWGALKFDITGLDPEDEKKIKDRLDELQFRTKAMQADEWGLAFGWSPLYLVVDDTGQREAAEPQTPFEPDKTQKVYAVHNIAPRDVRPLNVEIDPKLPNWREPGMYRITLPPVQGAAGSTLTVHNSRLLPFWGLNDSRVQQTQAVSGLWDGAPRPYADQIYDELALIGALQSGAKRAALELVTSIFQFNQGAADLLGGANDATENLQRRLNAVSRSLGIARKAALGPGESLDIKSITTTGWKDLSDFGFSLLSLATGLPQALLFGEAPTGLSTDKGSWWAQLERTIQARRDSRVLPVLMVIIEALMVEQGIETEDWGIEFRPLGEMTDTDLATLREIHTRSDVMLYQAGVLDVDDLRSRYEGGSFRPSIELEAEDDTSGDDLLAALLAEEATLPAATEAVPAAESGEAVLLNGAQIQSALIVLERVNEGIVSPGAATILLSGVMPRPQAEAMVKAQTAAPKKASEVEVETEQAKQGVQEPSESLGAGQAATATDNPFTALVEQPADSQGQDSEQALLQERRSLAETMTQHGIDRCGHGRVNRCDICGIERSHAPALDENDEPCRDENGKVIWAVTWRALGDLSVVDSLDDEFRRKRYKIPSGASGSAQQALDWKDEHGKSVSGMTETGWRRARQLAKGGTISGQDLIEINAWFSRHGAEGDTKKVAPEHEDEPWRDNGYVSWLGWGGDTMKSYAEDVVNRNRD